MHMEIQNLRKERRTEASSLRLRETAGPSGSTVWCDDCRVVGLHNTNYCPHLAAYIPEVKQQWCRFCRSIGHEEQNCGTYDLMVDRGDLYRVQSYPASPISPIGIGGSPTRDRGRG